MKIRALSDAGGIRVRFDNGCEDYIYDLKCDKFGPKVEDRQRVASFYKCKPADVEIVETIWDLRRTA